MFPPGNTVSERWRRVGCSSAGPDFDPAIWTVQTPTQNKQTDKNTMTLLYYIKIKVFVYIILYMYVCCVYLLCIYKYTCMYIFQKNRLFLY